MQRKHDLGPLVEVYRGRKLGWSGLLTLMLPGSFAVLAPLFYGLSLYRSTVVRYGTVAANSWSNAWLFTSALAMVIFFTLAIYRIHLARQFVAVHKNGLRMKIPVGSLLSPKLWVIGWEQIAGISVASTQDTFLFLKFPIRSRATLYPNVGKPIQFNESITNLPELVSRIKASLYPRLLPSLKSNYGANQWLFFGPVGIQNQAIRINSSGKSQTTPWSRVERLGVLSGFLICEYKDIPSQHIPVSQIPNLELLLELIQQGVKS